MKSINIAMPICCIIILLFSCQADREEAKFTTTQKDYLNTEKLENDQRQFIKKANLDMQVKNCLDATSKIEQKTLEQKGFILKSELKKNILKQDDAELNVDSIKRICLYNTNAEMILRVPDTSLAFILQYAESLGDQVSARLIAAEDVSFTVKLNELNKTDGNNIRLSPSENNDTEVLKSLTKNEALVEDLKLKDEIKFSTIGITLQQPNAIETTILVNENTTWVKQLSFFKNAWYSMQKGFYVLITGFIFLLQSWWLVLLFFIGKYGYNYFKKRIAKVV